MRHGINYKTAGKPPYSLWKDRQCRDEYVYLASADRSVMDKVIFRWWKISLRSSTKIAPGEIKDEHEDFLYDERAQSEITQVFGKKMLEYVKRLASGHIDYLPRLPNKLLIRIIMELELEDIGRLAQVSKQFRKLCRGDELWERIYIEQSETPVTDDLRSLAEAIGWRKLFFTNKLKLQVQLRRLAKGNQGETDSETEESDDDDNESGLFTPTPRGDQQSNESSTQLVESPAFLTEREHDDQ